MREQQPKALEPTEAPSLPRPPFPMGKSIVVEDRTLKGTQTQVYIHASPEMYDTLMEAKKAGLEGRKG